MRILILGGTRFIGVALTKLLVAQGHEVVLLNRGNNPPPVAGLRTIICDRTDPQALQAALAQESFDAIFDNNGRELRDTQPLVELFQGRIRHFVYVSSAGVYREAEVLPHFEGDAIDPNSRHRGKWETEMYLHKAYQEQGFPYTAIRPVYIYGPGNYNDVEAWFFDRISQGRPIPIPGDGKFITQLGHVADLAAAMVAVLGNSRAIGEIYNISDMRYVTYVGIAQACAAAMGKSPDSLQFVFYDPDRFDFGKRKAFPFRLQHFFCSIDKALNHLDWEPEYDLVSGLRTSYEQDYLRQDRSGVSFATDEMILAAQG
ncbi:MAG: NAD-dependent epimerase/dehydratase family protein [Pseudanabaenaceae cyanobacterium]